MKILPNNPPQKWQSVETNMPINQRLGFKANQETNNDFEMFEFGDPEPVLDNNIMDALGTYLVPAGEYYRPPIDFDGLVKLMDANGHHNSILHFKKNMLLKFFIPSKKVDYITMKRWALDYVVTGNFYGQLFSNGLGRSTRAGWLPAVAMRRHKDINKFVKLQSDGSTIEFGTGEVIHIQEPDIKQSIYGLPEYLGGIQSVLLSEGATLFRRRYYLNGAHMGYILLTHNAGIDKEDAKLIKRQVTASKGPGNFRSMYLNVGKTDAKEPVKVIPIGDIGTKDEFERVKNITRGEILSMHRMQAGLSGVMPENTGGFGDIEKTMKVWCELELEPLQQAFLQLNDYLGPNAVRFRDPDWKKDSVTE
jgi:PBSX family phage portal protein